MMPRTSSATWCRCLLTPSYVVHAKASAITMNRFRPSMALRDRTWHLCCADEAGVDGRLDAVGEVGLQPVEVGGGEAEDDGARFGP